MRKQQIEDSDRKPRKAALDGTDHRAIKQAIEALNRATEEFAARRMDAGVKRALAGRKIVASL